MGTDELAVVGPDTRVHGIKNLRVVDSSIFPTIPNGNLNAPTIMVAERAADLIRGREPLQPEDVPVHMDDQWQAHQRPGQAKRVLI
jgi:choline dehydrogenase